MDWRQNKNRPRPPRIFIEHDIYPTLVGCSREAVLTYLHYARFANKFTGLAFPTEREILKTLGFTAYNSNPHTGHARKGITPQQRRTRAKQLTRFRLQLKAALAELIAAKLIAPGFFHNSFGNNFYPGFYLLRANGTHRTVENGFCKNNFVMFPASYIDDGTLNLQAHHKKRPLLTHNALCVLLLAHRDFDWLRYNGIDPHQLALHENTLQFEHGTWRTELDLTTLQCEAAITELLDNGFLCRVDVVAHTQDLHFIRVTPSANAPDEKNITLLHPSAVDLSQNPRLLLC